MTYVYGIGPKTSLGILESQNRAYCSCKQLTEDEISRIQTAIDKNYMVEGDLQRVVSTNIKRLKDIGAYRGLRHKANLPSRGQRTRTNARTRRGKRITVGGTAKKVAAKT